MHAAQRGKPTPVEPTCRSGRRANGRSRGTKRSRAQYPLAAHSRTPPYQAQITNKSGSPEARASTETAAIARC